MSRRNVRRVKNAMKFCICSCKCQISWHLQLQSVWWKMAWNLSWKSLGTFELRFLRREEQQNFTRYFTAFGMATSTRGFRRKFHGRTSARRAEMTNAVVLNLSRWSKVQKSANHAKGAKFSTKERARKNAKSVRRKKAHKHKPLDLVALGTYPLCPLDKPRFSLSFYTMEAHLSQGQTQFVPGTIPGSARLCRGSHANIYCAFFPFGEPMGTWWCRWVHNEWRTKAEQFLMPRPYVGLIEPNSPWRWSLIELTVNPKTKSFK